MMKTTFPHQAFAKYRYLAILFPCSFHHLSLEAPEFNWVLATQAQLKIFPPKRVKDVITAAHLHFLSTKDTQYHLPACCICLQAFWLL